MTKSQSHILANFDDAVDALTELFILKYFDKTADAYWISGDHSGTLSINDYFFNLDMVIDAIRINATKKQVFDYYDYSVDIAMRNEPVGVNFKNYCKHGKELK